ncbi:hypothetical protein S245_057011, partial [Arachis hypogaea]
WQVQVANLQRSVRGDTESWKLYPQFGYGQGVKCGIYGANCPGWIISMEACNAHGLYCVPLYDTLGMQFSIGKLFKQQSLWLAKQEGLLVSLDLASFEMVRKFKPPLMKLLESGNIDLCFANQDEAMELLRNGTCSQEQGRNAAARKPGHSQSGEHNNAEAIRNFHIPSEKIPSTFRLLHVQQLPPWANTSSVAIDDVIQGIF